MTARPPIDELLARLMAGEWFARLAESMRLALVREGRILSLAAGDALFWRGDEVDGLYCVVEGVIEIGAVDAAGQEAILALVEPPMWFGEIAIIDEGPRTHDARANRTTTLLHVPQAAMVAILEEQPRLWRELARLTTDKLRLAFEFAEANAMLPAAQRIAARLAVIAEGYGGIGPQRTEVGLSQEKLGAMTALSRQTVNRILKRFEADGLVALHQGNIVITDLNGLKAASLVEIGLG